MRSGDFLWLAGLGIVALTVVLVEAGWRIADRLRPRARPAPPEPPPAGATEPLGYG